MPFQIVRNDITKVKADAIVNTANPKPKFASGTDAAIYTVAGKKELLQARKEIGDIAVGNVAVTPAFKLAAKYIIHTVGPAWKDGKHGESELLCSCYEKSLDLARELKCESIAFPLISTGVYGFPKDQALQIAIKVISKFLLEHDMKVTLVVFDRKSFELSGKLFVGVDEYIDEHYVAKRTKSEYDLVYGFDERSEVEYCRLRRNRIREEEEDVSGGISEPLMLEEHCSSDTDTLDDMMAQIGETFQQKLLRLVDEKGMSDVEVYKKANIDRRLFSKIRGDEDYVPSKKTAISFCFALQLEMDEAKKLLEVAGYALSEASRFDLIIMYLIENSEYNIHFANIVLNDYGEGSLSK